MIYSAVLIYAEQQMIQYVCMCTHMCVCVFSGSVMSDWDPMDCSLPGLSAHGIFEVRILESVAISYTRDSSQPRDQTHVSCVSCITGIFFTTAPPVVKFHCLKLEE